MELILWLKPQNFLEDIEEKTIVLTGAMQPARFKKTDAYLIQDLLMQRFKLRKWYIYSNEWTNI